MNAADGHRVVQNSEHKISNVSCTRWEEVTSTLLWHASFSAMMKAPTAIRLVHAPSLDQPQQVGIALSDQVDEKSEIASLSEILQQTPSGSGGGQLSHLREMITSCLQVPMELLKSKSMAIVYVTDRLPVDEDGREGDHVTQAFLETLNLLQGSPVWVVVRLSTDEQRVVDFYNDLDVKMELVSVEMSGGMTPGQIHLDVLDDYVSEAGAVHEHNAWLNYAYPLHLCRESVVKYPIFDALNDRPLSHDELVDFMTLLFDRNQQAWALQPLANPTTHYADFRAEISELNRKTGTLYDPIRRRVVPWIDMGHLDRIYSSQSSTGCSSCVVL